MSALICSPAFAVDFSDDFEGYDTQENEPIGGGWLWFLAAWNDWPVCSVPWFEYGPKPATNSNDPLQASSIVMGATGQALNVFSDYFNQDVQVADKCAEVSVFQETVVKPEDLGTHVFRFDVQAVESLGEGVRTNAFIKLLEPGGDYATVYYDWVETTKSGPREISIDIGHDQVGQILQFGFANFSNDHKLSGRVYDNVTFKPGTSGSDESIPP